MINQKGEKQTLLCKICETPVENVGNDTVAVTCHRCVMEQLRGFPIVDCDIQEDDLDD
jgi:hypothetical protein